MNIKQYFNHTVQKKFNIAGDLRVSLSFKDNYGTQISPNDFCDIVFNYQHSGSFFVSVEYNIVEQIAACVTVEVSIFLI